MRAMRVATWILASLFLAVGCGGMGARPTTGRDASRCWDGAVAAGMDVFPGQGADVESVDVAAGETLNSADSGTTQSVDSSVDVPCVADGQPEPTDVDGSQWPVLVGSPMVVTPTSHGFGLNVVLAAGDPSALRAHVRKSGAQSWLDLGLPDRRASDLAEWSAAGLDPGTRYDYEIVADGTSLDAGADQPLYRGSAITRRDPGTTFTFDLFTDSHIAPCDPLPSGTQLCSDDYLASDGTTQLQIANAMRIDEPDFLVHLGDMLDYHVFGFNEPPPDTHWARLAYLNYRRFLGDVIGHAAHFPTIGNWDGENGYLSSDVIQRSVSQRILYAPAPGPLTYPEGGSSNQDYYAFTWGDALFVVLNVMSYTPTAHLLSTQPGLPDDWTLGERQRQWLEATLAGATSKWRFLFIHHTVGGNAGDSDDSAYGRGGGRAAYVGEQAVIHQMMLKYGVQIFFFGHDHVFDDMVVDGIHYTLPGSAGAPWKFDGSQTGYTTYWTDSGHGRVTVSPTSVVVDFVAQGGSLLSSYTIN